MFLDQDSNVQIHANLSETVIHATLRPQDLIPAFLEVIKDTVEYHQMMTAAFFPVPSSALEDDDHEYWNSEDCSYFLNETLFNLLDRYAPEGYYFGNTEGNGSDFGYWEIPEDQEIYRCG